MKIKKGDNVKIIVGKDAGKTGKITVLDIQRGRIIVEGMNMVKKHRRPRKQNEKGEIISVARPIDSSNVMVICGSCSKPTKIGFRVEGENNKVRYCKKCSATI